MDSRSLATKLKFALLSALLCLVCACASETVYESDNSAREYASYDEESAPDVHPATYFMGTFMVHKNMPRRPVNNPDYQFFYKQCESSRRSIHFSRTEYTCNFR